MMNSLQIALGAYGLGLLIGLAGAYGKLYGGPILRDLLAVLRQSLPKVRVPVLMAHSRDDNVVDPVNMTRVFHLLGCEQKEMLWVEDCNHVIIREPQRETIFAAAAEFIERVCQN